MTDIIRNGYIQCTNLCTYNNKIGSITLFLDNFYTKILPKELKHTNASVDKKKLFNLSRDNVQKKMARIFYAILTRV
jgi:hypothetical protein